MAEVVFGGSETQFLLRLCFAALAWLGPMLISLYLYTAKIIGWQRFLGLQVANLVLAGLWVTFFAVGGIRFAARDSDVLPLLMTALLFCIAYTLFRKAAEVAKEVREQKPTG